MDETNVGPALILWLLFVTNPNWSTAPDRDKVAKRLGVTRSVVDYYSAKAKVPGIGKTATLFSMIGGDAGYGELGCPLSPDTILALAAALPALRSLGRKKLARTKNNVRGKSRGRVKKTVAATSSRLSKKK